jgi:hypothetical protein
MPDIEPEVRCRLCVFFKPGSPLGHEWGECKLRSPVETVDGDGKLIHVANADVPDYYHCESFQRQTA